MKRLFLLYIVCCFSVLPAGAQDDYDPLDSAALLISNKLFIKAKNELKKVEIEDRLLSKFQYLNGLVLIHEGQFKAASDSLLLALKSENEQAYKNDIYIALAKLNLDQRKHIQAQKFLSKVSDQSSTAFRHLSVKVYLALKKESVAFSILNQPLKGEEYLFAKERVSFYLKRKMCHVTSKEIPFFIKQQRGSDILFIAKRMREIGCKDKALQALELARMSFPKNTDIILTLASIYMDAGKKKSAHTLLSQGFRYNKSLAKELSLLSVEVGEVEKAVWSSDYIGNEKDRLYAKMAILIEKESYSDVVNIESLLKKRGLLEDDQLRYALAFSMFKEGHYKKTLFHLNRLKDASVYEKGLMLQSKVQDCQDNKWKCNEVY